MAQVVSTECKIAMDISFELKPSNEDLFTPSSAQMASDIWTAPGGSPDDRDLAA